MPIVQVQELNEKIAKLMNERVRDGREKQKYEQEKELHKKQQEETDKLVIVKDEQIKLLNQKFENSQSQYVQILLIL